MLTEIFNSRDKAYRSPMGAVASNTSVHFRIFPKRLVECSGAWLVVEKDGGSKETMDMFWCGMHGTDAECW